MTRGVFAPLAVVALALAMMLTALMAHGSESTLVERLVAAQPALQSKTDEPVDPLELAQAIASVPRINRDWAALLLTIAAHESALSARIARGDYREREADSYRDKAGVLHHRAWGLFQLHSQKVIEDVWGSPDLRTQVAAGAKVLRSSFYLCSPKGALRKDWARATINAYAGHSCDASWPGLDARMATFERLRRKL